MNFYSLPTFYQKRISVNKNGCWIWTGAVLNSGGYGRVNRHHRNGKWTLAHRDVYNLLVGPIPEKHELHHQESCPKNCVNPEHLKPFLNINHPDSGPTTNRNLTHCPKGHPYSESNTYHDRNGRRCRQCNRERAYLQRERMKILRAHI